MLAVATLTGCAAKQQPVYVIYNPAIHGGLVAAQQPVPAQPVKPAAVGQKQKEALPRYTDPVPGRHYLDIGANPVNENRSLGAGEKLLTLDADVEVVTQSKKGTISRGFLHGGEQVFVVPASDPKYWEAVAIKRCGNPILNRAHGVGPVWILESTPVPVAQPVAAVAPPTIVKEQPPQLVTAAAPPEKTCREKKTGWGSVIGGAVVMGVGLLTPAAPAIIAGATFGGSMFGGWLDGGCIVPSDVMVGMAFGALGAGLANESSGNNGGSSSDGPGPVAGNGTNGPGPIAGN
ncbi:TPA: hypothetical protein DDX30_01595 [Candidatus Wolfebacteria bacterium]|nr:hypothetical protein [Candidatus Wolfebacteria bacterium]